MGTGEFNVGGNPALDWLPIQGLGGGGGGSRNTPSRFMLQKPEISLRMQTFPNVQ